MSHWIVIEPDEKIANTDQVDWLERGTGGQSKVVSYWSGPEEHKITYANDAEAIQAIDDWLAVVEAPPPPPAGGMVPGDTVLVSHHNHAKGALGEQFTAQLIAFPTVGFPFWVVLGATATMYVDNVTVSKSI